MAREDLERDQSLGSFDTRGLGDLVAYDGRQLVVGSGSNHDYEVVVPCDRIDLGYLWDIRDRLGGLGNLMDIASGENDRIDHLDSVSGPHEAAIPVISTVFFRMLRWRFLQ